MIRWLFPEPDRFDFNSALKRCVKEGALTFFRNDDEERASVVISTLMDDVKRRLRWIVDERSVSKFDENGEVANSLKECLKRGCMVHIVLRQHNDHPIGRLIDKMIPLYPDTLKVKTMYDDMVRDTVIIDKGVPQGVYNFILCDDKHYRIEDLFNSGRFRSFNGFFDNKNTPKPTTISKLDRLFDSHFLHMPDHMP